MAEGLGAVVGREIGEQAKTKQAKSQQAKPPHTAPVAQEVFHLFLRAVTARRMARMLTRGISIPSRALPISSASMLR